ncbi:hypothetical protein GOODEAATRI_020803 [Goodea atripinnis]|uniref:Uncharacterized protein n=1 Tax=Goodea atripinnis TaxID=208336 RepID=A0ABV0MTV1_9TELE
MNVKEEGVSSSFTTAWGCGCRLMSHGADTCSSSSLLLFFCSSRFSTTSVEMAGLSVSTLCLTRNFSSYPTLAKFTTLRIYVNLPDMILRDFAKVNKYDCLRHCVEQSLL